MAVGEAGPTHRSRAGVTPMHGATVTTDTPDAILTRRPSEGSGRDTTRCATGTWTAARRTVGTVTASTRVPSTPQCTGPSSRLGPTTWKRKLETQTVSPGGHEFVQQSDLRAGA